MNAQKKTPELSPEEQRCAGRLRQIYNEAKRLKLVRSQEDLAAKMGGYTQGYVWQLINGHRPVGLKAAMQIARVLDCDPRDISLAAREELRPRLSIAPEEPGTRNMVVGEAVQPRYIENDTRYIPLLTHDEAANWSAVLPKLELDETRTQISLDPVTAARLSRDGFALEIKGEAMQKDFKPGDIVVVDPDREPDPGDIVIALIEHGSDPGTFELVVRKYRDRGRDDNNMRHAELIPLNPDYAPQVIEEGTTGEIIGPVVEHRRILKPD